MMPDGISCLFCTDPFTMTCGPRIVPWRQDMFVTDSVPKRQIFLLGLARVRVYGRFCSFSKTVTPALQCMGEAELAVKFVLACPSLLCRWCPTYFIGSVCFVGLAPHFDSQGFNANPGPGQ